MNFSKFAKKCKRDNRRKPCKRESPVEHEYIIRTINLSKKFNRFSAVRNLDLKVEKGQIFGFLGPNGAGKSTTIRMLLSLITPTKGSFECLNKYNYKIKYAHNLFYSMYTISFLEKAVYFCIETYRISAQFYLKKNYLAIKFLDDFIEYSFFQISIDTYLIELFVKGEF